MMTDPDNLARILKVLSSGTRVRIVQLLQDRALCVNALASRLDVTQGAVSQHLRVMRDVGLVVDERRGYHVHYSLNQDTLGAWREAVSSLLTPSSTGCACAVSANEGAGQCAAARVKRADAGSRSS
jgi:DNA-binding transcriptional ArsR family regulator